MFYLVVQGLLKWISPPPLFPVSRLPADDQRRRSGASQLPPPSPVLPFSFFFTLIRTPTQQTRTFTTESDTSPKSTSVSLKLKFNFGQVGRTRRQARAQGRGTQRRSPLSGHRSLARSLPGKNNTHLGFLFHANDGKLRGLKLNEPPRKTTRERGEARPSDGGEQKV